MSTLRVLHYIEAGDGEGEAIVLIDVEDNPEADPADHAPFGFELYRDLEFEGLEEIGGLPLEYTLRRER